MSYFQERRGILDMVREGRVQEANDLIKSHFASAAPYSGERWHALNDHFAIARLNGLVPDTTQALFSPDFIAHRRLGDILDSDVKAINAALEEQLLSHGYRENPREVLGISGEEKLIISDALFLVDQEPFRTVWGAIQATVKAYLASMSGHRALRPFMETSYRHRVFASATRGDGFHPPHIHSKAGFVVVYYVRVFEDGPAELQFGTHTVFGVSPFATFKPVEGDLFIFPAYFSHSSTPTRYEGLRATIGVELEPGSLSE